MINNKKTFILIVMLLGIVIFGITKLYSHEKRQSTKIQELQTQLYQLTNNQPQLSKIQGQLDEVTERLRRQSHYYLYDIKWGDGFNYLAIGNSLTLIGENWGRGICSTLPDNDYYGLVNNYLKDRISSEVTSNRLNYAQWERANKRDLVLDLLDVYLSKKLDLVTIQLGENASDISSYKEDLKSLVNYIQAKAPKAQIIIIDDFWNQTKSNIRKEVAKELNLGFADLSEIRGKREYQSKEGKIVKGINGEKMSVSKEAETHPDDTGFKYIAEKIIDILNK